jgi:hypothetical protein
MPANDAGRTICNKGVILVWWSQRKYYNLCLYKNLDIILFSFDLMRYSDFREIHFCTSIDNNPKADILAKLGIFRKLDI